MSSADANDEEASTPFLGRTRNTFSSVSEEPSESPKSDRKVSVLSNKRIAVLCVSVVFFVAVVAVICVVAFRRNDVFREKRKNDECDGNECNRTRTTKDRMVTLDDVLEDKYSFDFSSTEWVSDRTYMKLTGSLAEFDAETDSVVKTILPLDDVPTSYQRVQKLSPDGQWFLFSTNTRKLYRHSFYADYYIKNLKTNETKKILPPNHDSEQIRYCSWASVGNALVFVHKCDIYFITSSHNVEKYYRITDNGVPKKVFNGVPDWVYEEEIIESTNAIEFSSDGRYMSYVTFDASKVPFFRFPFYGAQDNVYTAIEKIAYPKAGFPNPSIKITIVDLEVTLKEKKVSANHLNPPREISGGDYYYAVMKFNGAEQLFIQWMNRAQNKTMCMVYKMDDSEGTIAEQHQVQHGWVDDDYVAPKFAADGSYYVTMLPRSEGKEGKFRHLAKVTVSGSQGSNIEFLTGGTYTVYRIDCWNPDAEVVYFRSNELSTRSRHVYRYNLKSNTKECISCGLIKDDDGTNCTYHSVAFSTQCSWLDLICLGPIAPRKERIRLETLARTALISNEDVREDLKEKDLPVEVFYTVKSQGFDVHVKETRPKYFDKNRKYAVLFSVYGGPNHQKVTDVYGKVNFDTHFVTAYDCILVYIDARGSGNYGYKYLYAVYRNLGHYESIDAIAVAKYLQKQSYVDPDRIGIWGWSYGGFFSSTVLAVSNGVFKTAVSVAPVTDWRYYDTVYSERYMGFPTAADNLKGYQDTSVMSKASMFRGKDFFLIHGTADDNVHFQNSAQLVSALTDAQVTKFRSQFYTDRDHNIRSRGHIYRVISNYLVKMLKLKSALDL